jgi:hypothetical protein
MAPMPSDYELPSPLFAAVCEVVLHLPGFYGIQEEVDEHGTYIYVLLHVEFDASMDVLREHFPDVRFVVKLANLQYESTT